MLDSPALSLTKDRIRAVLIQLESLFKPGAILTLIMRHPDIPDGTLLVTADSVGEIHKALRRLPGVDPDSAFVAQQEELEALRGNHEALARIVGEALIAATLAPGESLAEPSGHAITGLVLRLCAERDEARRERDELRATLAKLSEAATAFDDDLSSDCDCLSRYDLRDAVKAADNAAKVSP